MINNFPAKNGYNPGGYKSFLFIPFQDISSQQVSVHSKITLALGLHPGKVWLNGYSTAETLNFKEECIPTVNGPTYLQVISGFVPGERPELIDLMAELEGMQLLVQLLDTRGQKRIVGCYGFPLTFNSTYDSGSNRPDAKGFTYKMTVTSRHRAPVYQI
jgi:hypothetical protein